MCLHSQERNKKQKLRNTGRNQITAAKGKIRVILQLSVLPFLVEVQQYEYIQAKADRRNNITIHKCKL